MKSLNKYFIGLGLIGLMSTTACTGDLDVPVKDPNQSTIDKLLGEYTPEELLPMLATEMYQGLATSGNNGAGNSILGGNSGDAGANAYTRAGFIMNELTTDEYSWLQFQDAGYWELVTLNLAADNVIMYNCYSRFINEVALCNQFIRTVKGANWIPDNLQADAQEYIRQARIIRGLAYYNLIDCFGNAGWITEDSPAGTAPPQVTRLELYQNVVADLEAVSAEYGDSYVTPKYGYVGKEACDALLVKFYLNAQTWTGTPAWDKCWNLAQKIIRHHSGGYNNTGLAESYLALFGANNDEYAAGGSRTNEIIWTIPQDGINLQSYGGSTFYIAAACGSYDGISSVDDCNLSAQWTCMVARQQLSERFDFALDQRASIWKTDKDGFEISNPTIVGNAAYGKGYAPLKFTNYAYDADGSINEALSPSSSNSFASADWPVIRLADIYLAAAECQIRGNYGDQATALQYVNNVRGRAGIQPWGASDMTPTNLLDERSRELYGENHRRTDLVRFGRFAGGAYNWNWKGGVHEGAAIGSYMDLFPIPTLVINFQGYKQNPGY